MRLTILGTICAVLVTTAARGQDPDSLRTPQDSALFVYKQTLLALRDSTAVVRGAITQFRRDLQLAGAATVINRAERLSQRCGSLRTSLEGAEAVFQPARALDGRSRDASRSFLDEVHGLEGALQTHCLVGLAPSGPGVRADSLKAWGPYHTSRLERQLLTYDGATAAFARAVGIRLELRGTGVSP